MSKDNFIKLSVVIPAYNEEKNLKQGALGQVIEYFGKQDYPYEVLIVDDGSLDHTVELLEQQTKGLSSFKILRSPHGGKAVTVMTGMLSSVGDIVVFTDMDQATPIDEVEKLLPKFKEGFDIVIGSREGRKGAPLARKLMAWGWSLLRGVVLGLPFKDTQCGFKAFNRKAIEDVFPDMLDSWQNMKSSGAAVNAGFDVETLFLARKRGLKIAEVLIVWRHVESMRVQAINDSIQALKDMLRIRLNDLKGKYK